MNLVLYLEDLKEMLGTVLGVLIGFIDNCIKNSPSSMNRLSFSGTFAVLWCILWFLFVSECPHRDNFIRPEELQYISNCLGSAPEVHVILPFILIVN